MKFGLLIFLNCESTCDSKDVQASIYDRKTADRPFDTIHDILRCLSLVKSLLKIRNAPSWRKREPAYMRLSGTEGFRVVLLLRRFLSPIAWNFKLGSNLLMRKCIFRKQEYLIRRHLRYTKIKQRFFEITGSAICDGSGWVLWPDFLAQGSKYSGTP